MSSYRNAGGGSGAWDGGPPGAEAEYAGAPATDPWTGQPAPAPYQHPHYSPGYDYQAYAATYGYRYDPSYYQQRPDGAYYNNANVAYSQQAASSYSYAPPPREATRSPVDSRYDRRRSYSRSVSPYDKKDTGYSKKRDSRYEERRGRSRSKSKSKRKYSSSDCSSSHSRSYSRSPVKKDIKRRRSVTPDPADKSQKKGREHKSHDRSKTPPVKKPIAKNDTKSHSKSSRGRSMSKSPRRKAKSSKDKSKGQREVTTPPIKKRTDTSVTPPKSYKKSDRSSLTPPRSYMKRESLTPPRSYKSGKGRESSVTPPKCYARRTSTSSDSHSRTPSPRPAKRNRSPTPKKRRHPSRSSSRSSGTPPRSRSNGKSRKRHSGSSSRSRSRGKSASHSRRRSTSRVSKSRSRSPSSRRSRSGSGSGSASEDERRGQFTVADRKRFWKLHKSRQRPEDKSPSKEVKPPPGAVENAKADDIEYGDPPEVEGPNFAELLPTPDQVMSHMASSSKSKNIPIPIKNDGSFLEMFKKMQEATKKIEEVEKKPEIKKPLPFIGKRRGGRVLKTGMVKKAKAIDEQTVDNTPKDAWSLYMQEVKKYRETSCEEERKTRPLVK